MWLPHDAQAHQLGTGKSIEEITRAAGFTTRIVPKLSIEDGINALRTVFPLIYWDKTQCADLIQALRHYRYDIDEATGTYSRKPFHDDWSHFADAARYFAVGMRDGPKGTIKVEIKRPRLAPPSSPQGWMR